MATTQLERFLKRWRTDEDSKRTGGEVTDFRLIASVRTLAHYLFAEIANVYYRPGGTDIAFSDITQIAEFSLLGNHDSGTGDVAGIAISADQIVGRSGSGDVAGISCTAAGRALLDDANAAAQATTLGLGTGDSPTWTGATFTGTSVDFAQEVRHSGDTDTYLTFAPDQINLVAGGVAFYRATEDTQDVAAINPDQGDIDINLNWDGGTALAVLGSSGTVGVNVTPSSTIQLQCNSALDATMAQVNTNTSGTRYCNYAQFSGVSNVLTTFYWLACLNSGGLLGGVRGDGGSANVVYAAFTGGHSGLFARIEDEKERERWPRGTLLRASGVVDAHMPRVERTERPRDPGVIGVYTGWSPGDEHGEPVEIGPRQLTKGHRMAAMKEHWERPTADYSALGTAQILVCDENGPVRSGDLICSSSIPGVGMRQGDDLMRASTAAKCTQDIEWDALPGRARERRALVACVLHCG